MMHRMSWCILSWNRKWWTRICDAGNLVPIAQSFAWKLHHSTDWCESNHQVSLLWMAALWPHHLRMPFETALNECNLLIFRFYEPNQNKARLLPFDQCYTCWFGRSSFQDIRIFWLCNNSHRRISLLWIATVISRTLIAAQMVAAQLEIYQTIGNEQTNVM